MYQMEGCFWRSAVVIRVNDRAHSRKFTWYIFLDFSQFVKVDERQFNNNRRVRVI